MLLSLSLLRRASKAYNNELFVRFFITEAHNTMAKIALFSLLMLTAAGIAYLALSNVPAPTQPVSKPIPTERFFNQ